MTGEEFKAWRLRRGLTQWSAAQALGYSSGHVSLVETNRRQVSDAMERAMHAYETAHAHLAAEVAWMKRRMAHLEARMLRIDGIREDTSGVAILFDDDAPGMVS